MQQSISFSLIIIPLCQTKLENSSLNVISFSVKSSPARFSPPRPERSFQNVSGKAFTSSVGKIVSNHLWQGFHLLGREIVSSLLWQGFDFIDREDRSKPSLARLSPPRPGRSFSNLLMQGFHLLDRKSDASCNSLRRYSFWLKTPYTGYGALVETPDFRQYNKNRRIEAWIGRFGSVFVHELSLFHGC